MIGFTALGTQLADRLRVEIVTSQLLPGDRLIETEIAERFDVSRGPVRDAIKELATEGLVEVRKSRAYVVGMSDRDVAELFQLRELLEGLAVELVIEQRATVDWEPLEAAINAQHAAAQDRDPLAFAKADLQFHDAIFDAPGHRRLARMWGQVRPTFAAMLTLNAKDRDLHPSVKVHEELLKAIRHGVDEQATKLVHDHLAQSRARISAART